ncbi:MAG: MarC family protein [Candidatus Woesearchaeota archaeon]
MLDFVISFLIMLNPFALFLYLSPIMKDLSDKDFLKVFFKATMISFGIFVIFFLSTDFFFTQIFRINFESFRIFGGIVIFSFAYYYIVKGEKAMIVMKGDLDDLASEIALPFMVGAGTISLSMLMSEQIDKINGIICLLVVLMSTYAIVVGLKFFKKNIETKKFKLVFDRMMEILLRLNGFFVGAIGVNMIIMGIHNLFF